MADGEGSAKIIYVGQMQAEMSWTPDRVAEQLLEAYRRVHGAPVMSKAGGFEDISRDALDAIAWPDLFVSDARDRRILRTWARCRATGESASYAYGQFGWPRETAERRRRAALAMIATALDALKVAETRA